MAKLGQHFMTDKGILSRLVGLAELQRGDAVLEIGPGRGSLTALLAERCSVVAIEKDEELFHTMKQRLLPSFHSVKLIHGDAVKLDWPPFNKCVSNLPYRISKPFILKLLRHDFELAVLVVQEEFAKKLAASPGERNYGSVSACTQAACSIELLDSVPKNAFKPQPRVESRIVRLRQRRRLESDFLDFVGRLFQRRNRLMGRKRVRELSPDELMEIFENDRNN